MVATTGNDHMRVTFTKSLSVLLGIFLGVTTSWQGGSAAGSDFARGSAPACHCCNSYPRNCSRPACCASQPDSRAPVSPAVPHLASGSVWQALAPASLTLLTLGPSTLSSFPLAPSPVQAAAVPIFQRDCSFLI